MAKYFKSLGDSEFFTFQGTLLTEVTANAVLWGIPAGVVTDLTNRSGGYVPKYNAIVNKQTRTPQQVKDHRQAREDFEDDFIEDFAKSYIVSNPAISDSKVEALGFNRKVEPGASRPVIVDNVYGKIDPIGGSKVLVTCRLGSDSTRASMHEAADVVEMKYAVGNAPANVDECPMKEISTKAKFAIQVTAADAGKKIHAYMRWRNNSNPEKSGPWSQKLEAVIM